MKVLTLGTQNPDKLREIQRILLGIPLEVRPLADGAPEVDETEDTLEGNAALKAVAYAKWAGTWCLADDTGLEVAALGGAPGVRAARYAGDDASYADNRAKLLRELDGVAPADRGAVFACVMCLAAPSGDVRISVRGELPGVILEAERGSSGFGYDSLFAVDGVTMAEMDAEAKNSISHRGRALEAMRPHLLELL